MMTGFSISNAARLHKFIRFELQIRLNLRATIKCVGILNNIDKQKTV